MSVFAALAIASATVKGVGMLMDHEAQKDDAEKNEEAAKRALRLGRRDLAIRELEEADMAEQSKDQAQLRTDTAIGQSQASAASAGVRGGSVDSLVSNIRGDLGRYDQSVDDNLDRTKAQLGRHRGGLEAQAEDRINQVERPSLARTALRIGGVGLDAYTNYRQMTFVPGDD